VTNERIKQLRNKGAGEYALDLMQAHDLVAAYKGVLAECLDEIVRLQQVEKDAAPVPQRRRPSD